MGLDRPLRQGRGHRLEPGADRAPGDPLDSSRAIPAARPVCGRAEAFYRALAAQARFLSKRGQAAEPGLPRFEAMTGLLYSGLSLEGMEDHVAPALSVLSAECRRQVDAQGGIPTRNPEDLLEVFTLLTWVQSALEEAHRASDTAIAEAIGRIAPTLRTLRHADGGLARFHGGGRGLEGRLDQSLAASGSKKRQADGLAMGFVRLSAGRTSVIVDAAPPPQGAASAQAHASTLAFEADLRAQAGGGQLRLGRGLWRGMAPRGGAPRPRIRSCVFRAIPRHGCRPRSGSARRAANCWRMRRATCPSR